MMPSLVSILQVEQVRKCSACRVYNLQRVTAWSINTNFPCSTQKDFSMSTLSMKIFSFILPGGSNTEKKKKKSKSCRLVGHPIYLPPNTDPTSVIRNKPGGKKISPWISKNNKKLSNRVPKETYL